MAERRFDRSINVFLPPAECGVGELQELPGNLRSFPVLPQDVAMHERIFKEVDFPEQQVNSLLGPANSEEFHTLCKNAEHIEVIEDCESGEIAGYAILGQANIRGMLSMFDQFHPDTTAEVQSLVVSTDHQGKGAGSRLLAVCERTAQDKGYVDMILKTHRDNASILFYKAKGYAIKGAYNIDRNADRDRWILNKSIGTPEAIEQAKVRLERARRIKKVNRALGKLLESSSRYSLGSRQSIDAHVAQYLENRQMTIEDVSLEHRMLLAGELMLHNSGATGSRLREYVADVLQTDIETIEDITDNTYALFKHAHYKFFTEPEAFSYDMQSDKVTMANEPLDASLRLVIVEDELRNSYNAIAGLHENVRKSLARLAQDNPPPYIPRQMSKMIEWVDRSLAPASCEPSLQTHMFMYERVLSVFHQLAYCPDQVDAFLDIPAVTHSNLVKEQPIMNILPLRLWNASGNPNTVVRLLEFAQQQAPDGAAVAQYFVENILVLLQPGRERQMAELMERLPAVLPDAQRWQLQEKLATDKLWQIALRVGREDS